jgi:hypothetical protein
MPEITLALLRAVAHLPPEKAAHELNVGNTRFKAAIRQLGMAAWPYRKIKSIRNLMNVIQQNPELLGVSLLGEFTRYSMMFSLVRNLTNAEANPQIYNVIIRISPSDIF